MSKKENDINLFKLKRESLYIKKGLERDSILFKWKSNNIKLPFNPEFWLTTNGSIGFLKKEQKFVIGEFNGILDEYGDFTTYIYHTMNTQNVKTGEAKNHEDIIVCGNTSLYRPYEDERQFYAKMKAETDVSILAQLILSRLNKAIVAETDQKAKNIHNAYESVMLGYPLILTTSLLEELQTLDLTDNNDIQKMQYLSTFYQTLQKREANDFGIDLDVLDKRAQVSNEEIKQYDDITTIEFLIMAEARERFVEEMKENGFDIEIVKNPIFFDEPDKKDVDNGTFIQAEQEEGKNPQNQEENKQDSEDNTDEKDN